MRFIFWGPGGMLKLTKYIYSKKKPKTKSPKPDRNESLTKSKQTLKLKAWNYLAVSPLCPLKTEAAGAGCAKNTHATTKLRHVIAADSLTCHHDRHEPPTASEPQPKTVAVLPTFSPQRPHHTSTSSLLSQISVSPQQPYQSSLNRLQKPTTAAHGSSPRVHDNNLSEPASAKKGKLMEFVAADLFVCDWIWSCWFVHFDECEQLKY